MHKLRDKHFQILRSRIFVSETFSIEHARGDVRAKTSKKALAYVLRCQISRTKEFIFDERWPTSIYYMWFKIALRYYLAFLTMIPFEKRLEKAYFELPYVEHENVINEIESKAQLTMELNVVCKVQNRHVVIKSPCMTNEH